MKRIFKGLSNWLNNIKDELIVFSDNLERGVSGTPKIFRWILLPFTFLATEALKSISRVDVQTVLSSRKGIEIIGLLPLLGYVVVFMSLIDFASILFPLQLQNPEWELKTLSALINQSWAFLIGLGFIFTRYFKENQGEALYLEIIFLRFIRWFLLIAGIGLFLAVPLVFSDTQRLLSFVNGQVMQQEANNLKQISQIENRLAAGLLPQQLRSLGQSLKLKPELLSLPDPQLKTVIQETLDAAKQSIPKQALEARKERSISTWKNSLRTVIALIILGITFILIWFKVGQAF